MKLFYLYLEGVRIGKDDEAKNLPMGVSNNGTMYVPVEGVLSLKDDECFGSQTDYGRIQDACDIANNHPGVSRVVFMHNSPGGSVTGMEETYRSIESIKKPTYAYTSSLMASASYALACACDAIYASPSAVIGSIGARMMHFDISGMMSNMGINVTEFTKGENKMQGSPFRALSDSDKKFFQNRVDKSADQFFNLVKDRRKSVNESVFSSSVFNGRDGIKNGLVDGLLDSDTELMKFIR